MDPEKAENHCYASIFISHCPWRWGLAHESRHGNSFWKRQYFNRYILYGLDHKVSDMTEWQTHYTTLSFLPTYTFIPPRFVSKKKSEMNKSLWIISRDTRIHWHPSSLLLSASQWIGFYKYRMKRTKGKNINPDRTEAGRELPYNWVCHSVC